MCKNPWRLPELFLFDRLRKLSTDSTNFFRLSLFANHQQFVNNGDKIYKLVLIFMACRVIGRYAYLL